jgi:hypothetical protein
VRGLYEVVTHSTTSSISSPFSVKEEARLLVVSEDRGEGSKVFWK